jgi:hypothetical protein
LLVAEEETMKKLNLAIVIPICVLIFVSRPAHATSELNSWCVAEAQTWQPEPNISRCIVTGVATVPSSGKLTVLDKEFIINDGGIINNDGLINNGGFISNLGDGTIQNNGTINNNGGLRNSSDGTLNNYGTLNNDSGYIENNGTINNYCQAVYVGDPPFPYANIWYENCLYIPLLVADFRAGGAGLAFAKNALPLG